MRIWQDLKNNKKNTTVSENMAIPLKMATVIGKKLGWVVCYLWIYHMTGINIHQLTDSLPYGGTCGFADVLSPALAPLDGRRVLGTSRFDPGIWPHGDLTNEIWLVLNQAWKNSDVRHQKRGYTPFLFGQPIMRRWWTFGWNCVSQTKPNYSCCTLDEWNHRWPRVSFRSYAIWEKWFTLPFGEYQFKSGR